MMILRMISERPSGVLIRMPWAIFLFQVSRVYRLKNCDLTKTKDLTHILETLGDKLAAVETREMMALADEDGDGNINYEEFISMLFKVRYDRSNW